MPCTVSCNLTRSKIEQTRRQNEEQLRLQQVEKDRLELEMFEKKFGKRSKPKERKAIVKEAKKPINLKLLAIYVGTFSAVVIAVLVAFYADS